jgi:hypothetical protein
MRPEFPRQSKLFYKTLGEKIAVAIGALFFALLLVFAFFAFRAVF